MANPATLGAKLGPRLAELMLKAVAQAQHQGIDTKVRTSMLTQDMFFRIVGDELGRTVGTIFGDMAESEELPESMRPLLRFMASERGQAQALMGLLSSAQGLSQGFGGLIANRLAAVVQADFANHPHAVIDPGVSAAMVARGIHSLATGDGEAHRSAMDTSRFARLVELARSWPDYGAVIQLHQRGAMGTDDALHALGRIGYTSNHAGKLLSLDRSLLDVASAASMVVRGVLDQAAGRAKAKQVGFTAGDFDLLVTATGNPPGPMDLLTAWRRGKISRDRLHHGIRQGDLKNEWIDVIEALAHEPLPPAAAVEAAVEGHLTQAEAKRLWTVGGMDPADFDTAYQTAGSPPGIEQMLDLLNRGDMTTAEVTQGIRESRLKPKYTATILKRRRRLPPMDNIRMMVRDGVVTKEQGIASLMDLGYNHTDAGRLVNQAVAQKHSAERDLTKAEITSLYELRGIPKDRADKMLRDLGYDASEATMVLAIADLKRKRADSNAVAAVVRSKYIAHRIEIDQASTLLDSAGIPADQRDHLLQMWALERSATVTVITTAQAIAALKKQIIGVPEARTYMAAHGLDAHQQDILIQTAGINPGG